ncbi:hypothetical protein [Frog virus 3]|uniref:Uncharacterized protein n=3 Tax=Ranavirus rana1 TaxID=3391521 RepID=A0A2U9QH36_FRG3V|nr:hypothetical protein FV3_ORF43 [Frog virus 3]ASU44189.1 hypothetical protein RCV-Z2_ORF61 [Rana catesbeiana virus 2]AWU46801.1 hypothetical protein [Terrapene carolina carolina ranavirus]AWU46896.1 hypothetical protein [Trioceros melleri ranavirus]AWU46991.1 hypothetical protein [Trioceros melleri ranavirus]
MFRIFILRYLTPPSCPRSSERISSERTQTPTFILTSVAIPKIS